MRRWGLGVDNRYWGNLYLRGVWEVAVIGDVNIVGVGKRWGNGAEIGILILLELGQRFWNIYSMLLIQKTRK